MKKKLLIIVGVILLFGAALGVYFNYEKENEISIDVAINKWYKESEIDIKDGLYLNIDYLKELGIENISEKYKCAYVTKNDNSIEIEKSENCKNGDINDDGKIDTIDLDLLKSYLDGDKLLTNLQLVFSNINNDEYIDMEDYNLLLSHIEDKAVINKDVSMEDVSDILQYSVGKKELTNDKLESYDYNKDGKVNSQDSLILLQQLNGKINYNLGDLNKDGIINSTDSLMVLQHVSSIRILTEEQLKLADVNEDGVVNKCDSELILKYSVKQINNFKGAVCPSNEEDKDNNSNIENIPSDNNNNNNNNVGDSSQTTNPKNCIYGDVNNDSKVNREDSSLILAASVGGVVLTDEEIKRADVTLDGLVNSDDALSILKYISNNNSLEIIGTTFECK